MEDPATTIVIDTQVSRLLLSNKFETLRKKLNNYYYHDGQKLEDTNIFRTKEIYFIFHFNNHYFCAVVLNLDQACKGNFQETG